MYWRKKKPKRPGYVRPSRAKPKTGWSLRELASLSGTSARSLRLYLQRGLVRRPPFKGSATRYQRDELLQVLAIRRLRESERLELQKIGARLRSLSAAELETFATENIRPGALAAALGIQTREVPSATAAGSKASLSPHVPRWARIELALGLELHVREDASARVLELARRLHDLAVSEYSPSNREAGRP
jgi:DNA-binding transcriptional MerR regulator